MNEITPERANQLLKMFQYLSTRNCALFYEDNAWSNDHGITYYTQPCSFQRFVLKCDNREIAELKQKNGVFFFREA